MQPILLSVLIISKNHIDKTDLLLGIRAHLNKQDVILEQLKESARKYSQVDLGSIAEIILNYDGGNNAIFKSGTNSDEARSLKTSKCIQISKILKFQLLFTVNTDYNHSPTAYEHSPLGILLGVMQ